MENKTQSAVMILQNATDRGVQRGIYTLNEVNDIIEAIKHLNSLPDIEFGEIENVENKDAKSK